MSVRRLDFRAPEDQAAYMAWNDAGGKYVRYEDYAALAEVCRALMAQVEGCGMNHYNEPVYIEAECVTRAKQILGDAR